MWNMEMEESSTLMLASEKPDAEHSDEVQQRNTPPLVPPSLPESFHSPPDSASSRLDLRRSFSLTSSETTPTHLAAIQRAGSLVLGENSWESSSRLLLKKGLSKVDLIDRQIDLAGNKQVGPSLSTEESALLVDESGNLRDELGFEIGLSVGSQPPSRHNTSDSTQNDKGVIDNRMRLSPHGSNIGSTNSFFQTIIRQDVKNQGLAQRKAWDDFLQQIDGRLDVLSTAELQRWRKNTPQDSVVINGSRDSATENESDSENAPSIKTSSNSGSKKRLKVFSKLFRMSNKESNRQQPSSLAYNSDSPLGRIGRATGMMFKSNRINGSVFTQLIRQHGIPTEIRAQIWLACSGAREKQQQASIDEQYENVLGRALASPPDSLAQIEHDLHRTFPTNYVYQQDEGIASLRHVLMAYSVRNPSVGYCQSMNFIVATLLLHMDESDAFWVLSAIVEDLIPGYFSRDLIGVRVDQGTFIELVALRFPRVAQHLDMLQMPLSAVTYQWFMCLFVNTLPLGTTLRVWDVFLHEGAKALFRIALTIIKVLQRDILACTTFQEAYEVLSEGTKDRQRFSGAKVFKAAFDPLAFGSFSSRMLLEIRHRQLIIIQREQQQQDELTSQSRLSTSPSVEKGHLIEDNDDQTCESEHSDRVDGEESQVVSDHENKESKIIRERKAASAAKLSTLKRSATAAGITVDSFSWGFTPRSTPFWENIEDLHRPRANTFKSTVERDDGSSSRKVRARSYESSLPHDLPGVEPISKELESRESCDQECNGPVKDEDSHTIMDKESTAGTQEEADDDATIWDDDDDDGGGNDVDNDNDTDLRKSHLERAASSHSRVLAGSCRSESPLVREEKSVIPTVDLPAEYSQRLRSLSYVMSARQTTAAILVPSTSRDPLTQVPEEDIVDFQGNATAIAESNTRTPSKKDSQISQHHQESSLVTDPPVPITSVPKKHIRRSFFTRFLLCGNGQFPTE